MATVNPYFQSGRSIGRASEQNLYENLIIESMKIYGFEVYYLPRSISNPDLILTEDPTNKYEHAFPIEMYLQEVEGFAGDDELISKFGLEIRNTANFVVSRRRWSDVVGSTNTSVLSTRPTEGDIIYFPQTQSFFEIRKVDSQIPFFQAGKLYTYKMNCELIQFSNEIFDTGVDEIDNIAASFGRTVENYDILLEDAIVKRFLIAGSQSVTSAKASQTYSTPWGTQAQATLTVTFGDANQGRYFFNSGGKIRFVTSLTGAVSTAQVTAWVNFLNAVGTQSFGADTDPAVNYYTLTNSYQTDRKSTRLNSSH
jgi:hypothetical protein